MIYSDTSSFLKLLLPEDHSIAVHRFVDGETEVVVSDITELEAHVRLHGMKMGGILRANVFLRANDRMEELFNTPPFRRIRLSRNLFQTALAQHRQASVHCRSLDRLHLAAMGELGVRRLMTGGRRRRRGSLGMRW